MLAFTQQVYVYDASMAAKPVQVSLDTELLQRIDADEETRTRGRSAFIRSAVERYLAAKGRREIDTQIAAAYSREADSHLTEVVPLVESQAWPDD